MSAETDLTALLAEHAVRSTATEDVVVCTCGRLFHSDTAEYTQLDEDRGIVRHAAHVAGVVTASFAVTPLRDAIVEVLSETYLPGGIDLYLNSPNHHLGGRRPVDVITAGEGQLVLGVARRIEGGL
ncbi:MbcA/ParS/Xre antitoxin family protein [Rhodococcus sp. NPDC057297]|uniref:MbcA/ParS/Xre antitoxin family protein n=1 Tax=Rhodococcus sp. NPDC057297 TaxID=3346090 RepID=UPI00363BA3DB